MKNLVIVESPAKAKTIEGYLGKDFSVKSSFGHIRDLPSKGMSVDIENNFEPQYEVADDKKKVVSELKKAAKEADAVWLASDRDREGEAIAWHLVHALKLDEDKVKRIVFQEITQSAIEEAVANPGTIDKELVDAQQARRVLDRLVGYELSPVLWKKVQRGLSAGRVQSVAVRLIVEREREIKKFEPEITYKVSAVFVNDAEVELEAEVAKKLNDKKTANDLLDQFIDAKFKVSSIESKPGKRSPSAPFTTSTLQQEASRKLGMSVRQTMTLAQKLYEAGKITYMRTDSVELSDDAMKQVASVVKSKYGDEAYQSRAYKSKAANAQEAHEAIRPTNLNVETAGSDDRQKKLYELIWQRAVSSQMADAKIEKTTLKVENDKNDTIFQAKGEVITFASWLEVYPANAKDKVLPALKEGEEVNYQTITAEETFSKTKARYTEASLVKKLEELGIGRPSTYAPTISTIQTRGYVEKVDLEGKDRDVNSLLLKEGKITEEKRSELTGADKNKLIPTDIAGVVTDFLVKQFSDVIDYDFTAGVETKFDEIAAGDKDWQAMIDEFYGHFHKQVEAAENVSRKEAGGHRELGKDPKSGKPVIARVGRYGPMIQIGEAEDEEKPRFAPMPADHSLETVDLKAALTMFELPREVGKDENGNVIEANIGRYGPYVKVDGKFYSIKPDDPFTIDLDTAKEYIAKKQEADKNRNIAEFESGIKVLNGRYGPYVTDGKKNAKIPKDTDPKSVTEEDAKELLEKAPAKRSRRRTKK